MAAFPERIMIEPSGICNLQCLSCHNLDPRVEKQVMEPETFAGVERMFPRIREVVIVGNGEPFVNRNLIDYLGRIKAAGLSVRLYTNAQLLTREKIEALTTLKIDFLTLSVDAWEPQLYQRLRPPARFEKLRENIALLEETRRKKRSDFPRLWFNMVGMNRNFHQLPRILRAAEEFHAEKVTVTPLYKSDFTDASLDHPEPKVVEEVLRDAIPLARSSGVNLSFPPYSFLPHPYRPDYLRQIRYLGGFYATKGALLRQVWDKAVLQVRRYSLRHLEQGLGGLLAKGKARRKPYHGCPVEYLYVSCGGQVGTCCNSLDYRWGRVPDDDLAELWERKMHPALTRELLEEGKSRCGSCGRRLTYLGF